MPNWLRSNCRSFRPLELMADEPTAAEVGGLLESQAVLPFNWLAKSQLTGWPGLFGISRRVVVAARMALTLVLSLSR